MIQDVIRAIIQRVLRDKILMGLVVIGVVAIFVTGVNEDGSQSKNTEEKLPVDAAMPSAHLARTAQKPGGQAAQPHQAQQAEAAQQQQQFALEPTMASDFVKWWLGGAMDFQAATANKNHEQAFLWMTPEAKDTFKQAFWNEAMADGIRTGRLIAAFQPVSITPHAVNPDGTVVVSMKGSLVLQISGHPADTRQVVTDFLVKKEEQGLRIAAICNRSYAQAHSPTAYHY